MVIGALLNEGSNWVFTTLDMLEKGAITLKNVLTDQEDYEQFAKEMGIPLETLYEMQGSRHIISRETAECFADITWKLAYYKIYDMDLSTACYKEVMSDFC